ncbi:sugar phosphate isomerase/epimerase [Catenulispora yoronensis]|uniref:Sugar phosphate isomerase/epimerase n=1 Tax=Catenulispora yoronensis TaxID=450799 RepID=A0ABP5GN64_9ACTN
MTAQHDPAPDPMSPDPTNSDPTTPDPTTSDPTTQSPEPLKARIAGAPISWGVCEVPGWGHQLSADRVLAEMHDAGLAATEFGPDGFLPADRAKRRALLEKHRLTAIGGFVPAVLHEPGHDPWPAVKQALYTAFTGGADLLVLAAVTGRDGYDSRPDLDDSGWRRLFWNLDRVRERAAELGVRACLHPHVGTMIETGRDVVRLLERSATPLCLDTGHLLIGGGDPARLAREAPDRILHTHLKDVDAALAVQVRDGTLTYHDAVRAGLYTRLGDGDADIAGVVAALEGNGYQGWYVLEQDTVLDSEPDDGTGPPDAVRAGVAYLESLP